MRQGVTIRNDNGDEAATIFSVKRNGDKLVMDGMALGCTGPRPARFGED